LRGGSGGGERGVWTKVLRKRMSWRGKKFLEFKLCGRVFGRREGSKKEQTKGKKKKEVGRATSSISTG